MTKKIDSDTLRLGVIGPGIFWNKAHKPNLLARDDVAIAGFCAASRRRRSACAAEFPAAPFYTDLDAFLAEVACDAVLILAPIPLAADMVEKALRADKQVVTEKPLADTAAKAHDLARLAGENGAALLVGEQSAYRPVIAAAAKALADGVIGTPVSFDEVLHFRLDDSHPDGYGQTWRADGGFPLGVLFDGGIHNIANYGCLFGRCRRVYASGASLREGFGRYDHVLVQMSFDGGVRGSLSHAGYLGPQRNFFHIRGTRGLLEIAGETLRRVGDDGAESILYQPEPDMRPAHALMWEQFIDCLRNGRSPAYTAQDAARDIEILEAIDTSCHTGQAVNL